MEGCGELFFVDYIIDGFFVDCKNQLFYNKKIIIFHRKHGSILDLYMKPACLTVVWILFHFIAVCIPGTIPLQVFLGHLIFFHPQQKLYICTVLHQRSQDPLRSRIIFFTCTSLRPVREC